MIKVINIKRLVLGFGWAKSLSWEVTTEKEKRMFYFCIQRVTERKTGNNAYELIIGPLSLIVGLAKHS